MRHGRRNTAGWRTNQGRSLAAEGDGPARNGGYHTMYMLAYKNTCQRRETLLHKIGRILKKIINFPAEP